jgi:hypothetical protein
MARVSSEHYRFPFEFSFHLVLHNHHHSSSEAGTIGPIVAGEASELIPTNAKKLNKTQEGIRKGF